MKEKIKSVLVIALVAIIVLFGIFGGRKVRKYQEEIASLKYDKTSLSVQNKLLEEKVKMQADTIKKKDARIEELMKLFRAKDKEIADLSLDLNEALKKLNGITSDESYKFLQEIAYNFPGELTYLFNQLQVRGIHSDYLIARSSEKTIPALTAQINNAKEQFIARDSLNAHLNGLISLKEEQLANCQLINSDNDMMIEDLEMQRNKERHRKNFWRFTSAVAGGVAILLAAFGL